MLTILDLGYGREALSRQYRSEPMSSRLFYGLAQLTDKYRVRHRSLSATGGLWSFVVNNLRALTPCDVVYVTYFFPLPLVLLALLRRMGIMRRRKVIVVSHKKLQQRGVVNRLVNGTLDMVFFHSQLNLSESLSEGSIARERAAFLYWGDDLAYIDAHFTSTQGDFFLSTGREQRDYHVLLSAFRRTDARLELYTNRVNYSNNYEYLSREQPSPGRLSINFVANDAATTTLLAQKAASCLCVVNPLLKGEMTYCVGLTSIVEAMALGKPIITTYNPYSPVDVEKERIGFVVDDEQSWTEAISYINTHREEARQMGLRARRLAEQQFNVEATARQLDRCICQFHLAKR